MGSRGFKDDHPSAEAPAAPLLSEFPVHLDSKGGAAMLAAFTGSAGWYEDYATSTAKDGAAGRLVSVHAFAEDWAMWEMHPEGDELVVCLSGAFTLWQECPEGGQRRIELEPGQYAINPAGVWHTANTHGPAKALFVTSGQGTQHRGRN